VREVTRKDHSEITTAYDNIINKTLKLARENWTLEMKLILHRAAKELQEKRAKHIRGHFDLVDEE
jgi:hypothetical protein